MKAYIYVGGEIDAALITEHPDAEALTVAADSGWHNARLLGVTPKILLGDFDSIGKAELPPAQEILQVPMEKDRTDTQLAVDVALEHGADCMVIIGGLSGRLDHTMSNISLLERLWRLGVRAVITDGKNRVRYIERTSELVGRSDFKYLSLIAADKTAKGVSVDGCKYPLKNARLSRTNNALTTSNEILKNCALVSVKKGGIYIIESRD